MQVLILDTTNWSKVDNHGLGNGDGHGDESGIGCGMSRENPNHKEYLLYDRISKIYVRLLPRRNELKNIQTKLDSFVGMQTTRALEAEIEYQLGEANKIIKEIDMIQRGCFGYTTEYINLSGCYGL
jgi:hypothetical protein